MVGANARELRLDSSDDFSGCQLAERRDRKDLVFAPNHNDLSASALADMEVGHVAGTLGEVGPVDGDLEHGEGRRRGIPRTWRGRRRGRGCRSDSMCARYAAVGLWPTNTSTVASGLAVRSTSRAASGPAENNPSSYDHHGRAPGTLGQRLPRRLRAHRGRHHRVRREDPLRGQPGARLSGVAVAALGQLALVVLVPEGLRLGVTHDDKYPVSGGHGRHSGIPIVCLSCRLRRCPATVPATLPGRSS